jgi:hypothetical protein
MVTHPGWANFLNFNGYRIVTNFSSVTNLSTWPYWYVVPVLFCKFEMSAKWLAFSCVPSVSAVSIHSAYCHIHYVAAESANLDADGTVECHFSLEEFSAPPLTPHHHEDQLVR